MVNNPKKPKVVKISKFVPMVLEVDWFNTYVIRSNVGGCPSKLWLFFGTYEQAKEYKKQLQKKYIITSLREYNGLR